MNFTKMTKLAKIASLCVLEKYWFVDEKKIVQDHNTNIYTAAFKLFKGNSGYRYQP